eukprot:Seg418.9 transcript_id=Seg418.9/GoldUCD/mRNA.D3Y31 product="hypothetical protein" protein_id=Seg418.9/GoldUCD/D3Y31
MASKWKDPKNDQQDPSELFQENIRLKRTVAEMRKSVDPAILESMDDLHEAGKGSFWKKWIFKCRNIKIRPAALLVMAAMVIAIVAVYLMVANYSLSASNFRTLMVAKNEKQNGAAAGSLTSNPDIQNRLKDVPKKTFPDLDYALLGYNIMKGYPLAIGHDPGLTKPIFKSDYGGKRQTADCRYSVPKGLIVVPDISCLTSFTSEVIKDSYQLTKSLDVSAKVSAKSSFVGKFSASAEYKSKSSELSSKETVYINSEAKCDYYLSEIDEIQPPSLDESFILKVRSLKNTNESINNFFDYYGTHFLKRVTFGARFVYENKISKSNLQTIESSSSGVSLEASASLGALASFSAKAKLSVSKEKVANQFRELVETSTVSIGAPPEASGDPLVWASKVKENPVPTKFEMVGIENLFTQTYMGGLGIDYHSSFLKLAALKTKIGYCEDLFKKGEVASCKQLEGYVKLKTVWFRWTHYKVSSNLGEQSCISSCLGDSRCFAASFDITSNLCWLYSNGSHTAFKAENHNTYLFMDSMFIYDANFMISNAKTTALKRGDLLKEMNETTCGNECKKDPMCAMYSIRGGDCTLHAQSQIKDNTIE